MTKKTLKAKTPCKTRPFEAKPNAYRIRPIDRVFTHARFWDQGFGGATDFDPSF
jgi:hypothetical protein